MGKLDIGMGCDIVNGMKKELIVCVRDVYGFIRPIVVRFGS